VASVVDLVLGRVLAAGSFKRILQSQVVGSNKLHWTRLFPLLVGHLFGVTYGVSRTLAICLFLPARFGLAVT